MTWKWTEAELLEHRRRMLESPVPWSDPASEPLKDYQAELAQANKEFWEGSPRSVTWDNVPNPYDDFMAAKKQIAESGTYQRLKAAPVRWIQVRFPRSKKKRIQKKWRKNWLNWG